jgi:catechol-2,3-dioxygenase
LTVSDVAISERWYALVLGLERLTAADDGTYVALRHRPSKVVVVLSGAGPTDLPELEGGRLDHIAFAVPDGSALNAWADQLSDLGVEHSGVADEDGRPSLILTDPDGIQIELVAPPAR